MKLSKTETVIIATVTAPVWIPVGAYNKLKKWIKKIKAKEEK